MPAAHRSLARVMPCLLLRGTGLVKTRRFKDAVYVGDPRNAVKIFNEKEVDELILLDITATVEGRRPQFKLIAEIASEAFMPLAYGGGVRTVEDAAELFKLGVEKVCLNTAAVETPQLVRAAADRFGSQSIVAVLDVKRSFFGKYECYVRAGKQSTGKDPVTLAQELERLGAGELVVNSIDRDGTMEGYDLELLRRVTQAVGVPVIACGGAGKVQDLADAIHKGGASAAAAGSLFVFTGKHRAVLINFPSPRELAGVMR